MYLDAPDSLSPLSEVDRAISALENQPSLDPWSEMQLEDLRRIRAAKLADPEKAAALEAIGRAGRSPKTPAPASNSEE